MSRRSTMPGTEPSLVAAADAADAGAATATPLEPEPVMNRPLHERIASRAYEHYLSRGQQAGSDLDDWLRAERELGGGDTFQQVTTNTD